MEISEKEKRDRQHKKELKSLRNKMGSNIIWFDSLDIRRQYDLLFEWKFEKRFNKNTKPIKKPLTRRSHSVVKIYPPSLKHFIIKSKKRSKYKTIKANIRRAAIDIILDKK